MSFIEKEMDYFMFMQLKDLARTFIQKEMEIQYNQVSFLDIHTPKITISSFWENRTSPRHFGEKSDIYLRAFGNYFFSDRQAVITFLHLNKKNRLPSLSKQLLSFLEDLRLEEIILTSRPGTKWAFEFRRKEYSDYFHDQIKVNQSRGFPSDTLFCYICLSLLQGREFIGETVLNMKEETIFKVKEKLYTVFNARHTIDVIYIVQDILLLLEGYLARDMVNSYFTLPKILDVDLKNGNEDEVIDETLPSWTRKRKKETKETFLQFDDVDGDNQKTNFTKTDRESEATDQVMAIVQGQSQQSDLNDHAEASNEMIDGDETEFYKGKENRFAKAIEHEKRSVSLEDLSAYDYYSQRILLEKKRLIKLLKDLLERKRETNFRRLHFGKLDRRLVRYFTSNNPKMFVKKDENQTFDCTFSLLVDCSSSMMNKMEKTKESIVLFHETLRDLAIPHSVTGYWEDGMESDDTYQPNYFHEVISFQNSLKKQAGPNIMQLEPNEDNRDGFAIRYAANKLVNQNAAHKILLVLTDGKPAAFNYFQNGVMDTKEAIKEVQKKGIFPIGIQMDIQNEKQEKLMEAMYNNQYMIIESLEEMPSQFAAIIKKLMMKM